MLLKYFYRLTNMDDIQTLRHNQLKAILDNGGALSEAQSKEYAEHDMPVEPVVEPVFETPVEEVTEPVFPAEEVVEPVEDTAAPHAA